MKKPEIFRRGKKTRDKFYLLSKIFGMKITSILGLAMGVSGMFLGQAVASDVREGNVRPGGETAAVNPSRAALEVGMTAQEVQGLVGKPVEIKPIEGSEGKAETWIYRRQIGKNTTQDTIPSGFSSGALPASLLGTSGPVEYRTKITTNYQVTSLLMFEGKLVKAKQSVSQVVSFDR